MRDTLYARLEREGLPLARDTYDAAAPYVAEQLGYEVTRELFGTESDGPPPSQGRPAAAGRAPARARGRQPAGSDHGRGGGPGFRPGSLSPLSRAGAPSPRCPARPRSPPRSVPPQLSTSRRTIASPSPEPLVVVENRGSKIRGSSSAGIPAPSSPPGCSPGATVTSTSRAPALRAFSSRFTITSFTSSARAAPVAPGFGGEPDLVAFLGQRGRAAPPRPPRRPGRSGPAAGDRPPARRSG